MTESGTAKIQLDDALLTMLAHVGFEKSRDKLPAMLQRFPINTIKLSLHPHGIEVRGLGPLKPVFLPTVDETGQIAMKVQVNAFDVGFLGDTLKKLLNDQIDQVREMVVAQGLNFHLSEVRTHTNELLIAAKISQ
ncbi:MAG: hypothetical protein H0X24_20790 [Ktedonobacterales bacterium]|nr:hypothetical protein [Ktedonobacterales bacterium]